MAGGGTGTACTCASLQKSNRRETRKYCDTEESGGLPPRKSLHVGNQLAQIAFAESVRDAVDLISRKTDILGRLGELAEFIGRPAERTRHAAHKICTGSLLFLDGGKQLFARFRCHVLRGIGHTRGLLARFTRDGANRDGNLSACPRH
jgi:hypothetical protein